MSSYSVSYHDAVFRADLRRLAGARRRRVFPAVERKLMTDTLRFGKPLRSPLAPFRSLRVGDDRIVYLVEQNVVYVLAVGHRREIYEIATGR